MVHAPTWRADGTSGALARAQSVRGVGPAAGSQASFDTLGGQRRLPHSQGETHRQRVRARVDWTGELLQCDTTARHAAPVAGHGSGSVAVGDCAQAFLQVPFLEKNGLWVTPPPEALAVAQDLARSERRGLPPGVTTQRKSRKSALDWSRAREIPVYTAMCVSACGPSVTRTTT